MAELVQKHKGVKKNDYVTRGKVVVVAEPAGMIFSNDLSRYSDDFLNSGYAVTKKQNKRSLVERNNDSLLIKILNFIEAQYKTSEQLNEDIELWKLKEIGTKIFDDFIEMGLEIKKIELTEDLSIFTTIKYASLTIYLTKHLDDGQVNAVVFNDKSKLPSYSGTYNEVLTEIQDLIYDFG